jgi:hypothetical protein
MSTGLSGAGDPARLPLPVAGKLRLELADSPRQLLDEFLRALDEVRVLALLRIIRRPRPGSAPIALFAAALFLSESGNHRSPALRRLVRDAFVRSGPRRIVDQPGVGAGGAFCIP